MSKPTTTQITTLRGEANKAGDYAMALICEIALGNEVDTDDWSTLSQREADKIRGMSRDDARAAVADAIESAEAMVD